MALGKSLENILGSYFGENSVSLQSQPSTPSVAVAIPKSTTKKLPSRTKPTYSKRIKHEKAQDTVVHDDAPVSRENHDEPNHRIEAIVIDSIMANPYQTRTYFDDDKITSLAANIKENGLIQPIVVLQKTDGSYILLAGERRLRACKLLGWNSILSVIKFEDDVDDARQSLISAMENLQREDLSPIELAHTFKMLMNTQKTDEQGVASLLEKSVQYVRNYLRLLTLHPHIKEFLEKKLLSEGQVRSLVGLDPELQLKVARITLEKELTVKEVSRLIENLTNPQQANGLPYKSTGFDLPHDYIERSQQFISYIPHSKIKYYGTKDKGRIVVSWDSRDAQPR